jgi:hypothetical protein
MRYEKKKGTDGVKRKRESATDRTSNKRRKLHSTDRALPTPVRDIKDCS